MIADLRNNAKAATISRKAGGMPEPRECDRLIPSTWGLSIWLAISFAKHNAYQPGAQCSLEVIPTSVPSDDQPDAPCGLEVISKCDDQSDAPCSLAAICEVIPKLSCNVMFGWRESTITASSLGSGSESGERRAEIEVFRKTHRW